jgi:peptide/nickel transport system permease protein
MPLSATTVALRFSFFLMSDTAFTRGSEGVFLGKCEGSAKYIRQSIRTISYIFISLWVLIAAILTESALSFLGIGVQPPTPSWRNILMAGKDNIDIAWWLSLYPGLAILITVLGYNLLSEGIRDALDPRLRR